MFATAFFTIVVMGFANLVPFEPVFMQLFPFPKCHLLLSKFSKKLNKRLCSLFNTIGALLSVGLLLKEGRDVFSLFLCSGKCSK